MIRALLVVPVIAGLTLTFAACASVPPATPVGRALPALRVRDLDGKLLALESLRGRVVLLDIWASWCGPCREELPLLDEIAARLRARGVSVVAVSVDEDRAQAQDFVRIKHDWSLQLAHDPDGAVARTLQPPKMPSSYIVDRDGVVRQIRGGFVRGDAARIEAELTRLAGDQ